MTRKEEAMQHCKEHLISRDLSEIFNSSSFNHVYKKRNGEQGNPYLVGLHAADYMIINPTIQSHETGNES